MCHYSEAIRHFLKLNSAEFSPLSLKFLSQILSISLYSTEQVKNLYFDLKISLLPSRLTTGETTTKRSGLRSSRCLSYPQLKISIFCQSQTVKFRVATSYTRCSYCICNRDKFAESTRLQKLRQVPNMNRRSQNIFFYFFVESGLNQ